jgi:phosphotransferase system enzyme I (PtsI)
VQELTMAMFVLHGKTLAGGVAVGRARVLSTALRDAPQRRIAPGEVATELNRLEVAIARVQAELQAIADDLPVDAPVEAAAMLDVHVQMLMDATLVGGARTRIRHQSCNAEWAYAAQAEELVEQFLAFEDPYLRERVVDVRQIVNRVLRAMLGNAVQDPRAGEALDSLVVIATEPAPADLLLWRNACAFAIELAGTASHAAIVARGLAKPTVVGLTGAASLVRDDDLVVVDGDAGVLVVNPDPDLLAQIEQRRAEHRIDRARLKSLLPLRAATFDGVPVSLQGNIELPSEATEALAQGADGIGLLRSEFLFLNRKQLPEEEEQVEAYAEVVRAMAGRPVTIRTIDVGADKALPRTGAESGHSGGAHFAENPALGRRAIRFCLAEPELFKVQLRAILRASALGPVRLLIPMLTHPNEILTTRKLLAQARETLIERGQRFDPAMPVGGMIEVPAAAIAADVFARELDFLSIGTNDLTQYTLAIDRSDPRVAALYDPMHPAVLRLIARTIAAARRARRPVAVCGEMAGDPVATAVLIGMGLREFSMNSSALLQVKQGLLELTVDAARQAARQALRFD